MKTAPIPVTVGTFEGKNHDSYEDGGFEAPKKTTVTRMAMRGLISRGGGVGGLGGHSAGHNKHIMET